MNRRLTWEAVLAYRMRRQHLRERPPADAALAVVSDIAGLHAQVFSSAELTLWARVDDLPRDAVARATWEDRALVKTWAMRGTLHLLPARELGLWVGAQGVLPPRHHAGAWQRAYGLDRVEADRLLDAVAASLDGRPLTREQLATEVARRLGGDHHGEHVRASWGGLLKILAFRGELCFAPSDGRFVRFTRPVEWVGAWEPVEPEAAMAEVIRRHLAVYGPATREEFARWFGMTSAAQAERRIHALGGEVEQVEVDGRRAWMLAALVDEVAGSDPAGDVRLLPGFDQYVVAAPRDVDAVLPASHKGRVYRPQGWLSPVVVVDGRIVGTWRHERRGPALAVTVEPFARMDRATRAGVEAEAARLASFLGGEPAVAYS